jgi:hypothetical protein
MNIYFDRLCKDYQTRWQSEFSRASRRNGPVNAAHAQHYISILRAMRRRLLAGERPSLLDYRESPKNNSFDFMLKRSKMALDRAIGRGETWRAMQRCGLFGPLDRHNACKSNDRAKRKVP